MMTDEEVEDFLAHYGVKGMRWGVRKDRTPGVSRRTDREAKKDAQEAARAKMYYGKGAGTRRKLINKSVEDKRSKDSAYGKAFDRHYSNQSMSDHATGARKERSKTDRRDRNKKRAGYAARRFTGEMGTQAAFTAVAIGGAAYLRSPQGQRAATRTFNQAQRYWQTGAGAVARRKGVRAINQMLKNM